MPCTTVRMTTAAATTAGAQASRLHSRGARRHGRGERRHLVLAAAGCARDSVLLCGEGAAGAYIWGRVEGSGAKQARHWLGGVNARTLECCCRWVV